MEMTAFILLLFVAFLVPVHAQTQVFSLPGGPLTLTSPDGTLPGTILHTTSSSTDSSTQGSSTNTASQPGATPQLAFTVPANSLVLTCTSVNVPWVYIGPTDIFMSLSVTNVGVSQSSPPPTSPSTTQTFTGTDHDGDLVKKGIPGHLTTTGSGSDDSTGNVNQVLTTSIDPRLKEFTWSSVNVSQGWYIVQASLNGVITPSTPFFVQNGTDVSCLGVSPPPTTTSSGGPTSLPTTGTTSSGLPTGGDLPVGGVASGSNINKGAIAGGVIGGLAVLAAIVAAIFFYRYSSSASTSTHRPTGAFMGKWGNLGSFDSTARTNPARSKKFNGTGLAGVGIGGPAAGSQRNPQPNSRHNSQAESIGPIVYHGAPPGGSSEEYFSPYDEKYMRSPFSDPGHGDGSEEMGMIPIGYDGSPPSTGLATTGHATKHSSMASTYSYAQNNNFSRPRSQSTQYKASPQTFPESPLNTSNATLDTTSRRTSSPTNPIQVSTSSLDHIPPSPAYPSGASATMTPSQGGRPTPSPAGAGASAGSPMTPTSRRTPRKPVPTYNPQDPTLMSPPTRVADVPTDVRDGDAPDLAHKGSFGSFKQVHILMPDMPPPQKD